MRKKESFFFLRLATPRPQRIIRELLARSTIHRSLVLKPMSDLQRRRTTVVGRSVSVSVGIGALITLVGCAAETRTRIMHFFFEYPQQPAAVTEHPEGAPVRPKAELAPGEPPAPTFASKHPPFADRRCDGCHVPELGQAPRADLMTACRECHGTYFQYHRFGHAPAVSGDCRFCHTMHFSRQEALLRTPQATLCTSCHATHEDENAPATYHRGIARVVCTACHEGHFGDSQLLLKPEDVRMRAREVGGQPPVRETEP